MCVPAYICWFNKTPLKVANKRISAAAQATATATTIAAAADFVSHSPVYSFVFVRLWMFNQK